MSEHGSFLVHQVYVNDEVLVKGFRSGATWLQGMVVCGDTLHV